MRRLQISQLLAQRRDQTVARRVCRLQLRSLLLRGCQPLRQVRDLCVFARKHLLVLCQVPLVLLQIRLGLLQALLQLRLLALLLRQLLGQRLLLLELLRQLLVEAGQVCLELLDLCRARLVLSLGRREVLLEAGDDVWARRVRLPQRVQLSLELVQLSL